MYVDRVYSTLLSSIYIRGLRLAQNFANSLVFCFFSPIFNFQTLICIIYVRGPAVTMAKVAVVFICPPPTHHDG